MCGRRRPKRRTLVRAFGNQDDSKPANRHFSTRLRNCSSYPRRRLQLRTHRPQRSISTRHPQNCRTTRCISCSRLPKTMTGSSSPLGSPLSGQRVLPPPPQASYSHYAMATTSPGPSHATQEGMQYKYSTPGTTSIRQPLSTPNTPLSFQHAQQLAQVQCHTARPDDPMNMDASLHKHRASGFKRVRDQRELKPHVDAQPAGRRGDADGQFRSVSLNRNVSLA